MPGEQVPAQGYPAESQPGQPASPRPAPNLTTERGQRFASRPQPVWGGAIAAGGIAMGIVGIILWAGDYAVSNFGGSGLTNSGFGFGFSNIGSRTWLGALLSIAVMLGGFLLAALARRGPLATAGVTASAFAVPVARTFLTLGDGSSGALFNSDATVLVSIAVWLVSYYLIPGTRGHSLYIGLAAFEFWEWILSKVAPSSLFDPLSSSVLGSSGTGFASGLSNDLTELAVTSLVVGGLYYLGAFVLDLRGHRGAALPLAFAGFPAVAGGIALAAQPMGQAGVGLLLILVGLLLSCYGAKFGRRFTTWVWAAGSVLGVVLIVADAVPHNVAAAGITLLILGSLFVVGGVLATTVTDEQEYPAG
jgi:hypothetical protein